MAQIFCLTSSGGLPLLVRKKGDVEALSFSYIASLNGVHMFAKSQNVELEDTNSNESILCWKEFYNSLVLICISSVSTSEVLQEFIDSVFDAMVLCIGLDDLINIRNPERLKRELRITYKIIDRLFDNLECVEKLQSNTGTEILKSSININNYIETILCQESHTLQNCLESYLETIESVYGCMTIHGKVVVATPSWWELDCKEKKLLNTFISILSENTVSSDVPVFLPKKSPSVPFRLVTIHLLSGVQVSMLCGPNPSITQIEKNSLQIWRPIVEILRFSEKIYLKSFSPAVFFDNNVLGFMLMNISEGKFVINQISAKKEQCSLNVTHRLSILKSFYEQAVFSFLVQETQKNVGEYPKKHGSETYWCSQYHKCHALCQGSNLICILYAPTVSTYAMRIITKQCLKLLVSEKHFCW